MALVTATAIQPVHYAPYDSRANQVIHDFTSYLEINPLVVHNIKSATMGTMRDPRLSAPMTHP